MAWKTLIVEPQEQVLLIRLNRPEALNALNREMVGELVSVLAEAGADPHLRVVVLTGSDKAFAAGADVREMAALGFADAFGADLWGPPMAALARLRKPLIAAVNGYALGGGCELALACDTIFCGEGARFGQPETSLGIIAGMGGTQRLTRRIGLAKAMDMHLSGRMMDAAEAERSGLVSRVFPADRLLDETLAIARKIAARSMLALMAAKEAVRQAEEAPLSQGLLHERRLFQALFATEDQAEGMAAFLDKREPQFRDR